MLKVALVGVGRIGRFHLTMLNTLMNDGYPIELVALCDIDPVNLYGQSSIIGNLDDGKSQIDYSNYRKYESYDELLEKEELDYVQLTVPTYLHAEYSVKALKKGIHVFCEKPMARNLEECQTMLDAAAASGKQLMIGHCLRFWPEYVYLKKVVESGEFGKVRAGTFWRGGAADHVKNPSYQHWIINREKGGGGLFDQHLHDVDTLNWLFGLPNSVITHGQTVYPESAHDIVATTYFYDDDKIIVANDDTSYVGLPFEHGYKVNLEKATLLFQNSGVTVYEHEKAPYQADLSTLGLRYPGGHYNELVYLIDCLDNKKPVSHEFSSGSKDSIMLNLCEMKSADNKGERVFIHAEK